MRGLVTGDQRYFPGLLDPDLTGVINLAYHSHYFGGKWRLFWHIAWADLGCLRPGGGSEGGGRYSIVAAIAAEWGCRQLLVTFNGWVHIFYDRSGMGLRELIS